MATAVRPILSVKPDPRGRLAFAKAIEAVNQRLATHISGFDVALNDDGTLTLSPTVEVPAASSIVLAKSDWDQFISILAQPEQPNAALRRAAQRTADDHLSA